MDLRLSLVPSDLRLLVVYAVLYCAPTSCPDGPPPITGYPLSYDLRLLVVYTVLYCTLTIAGI